MSEAELGRILFAATGTDTDLWVDILGQTGREVTVEPDGAQDPSIHYAVVWRQPQSILNRLPNLKAIFSLGAGVDHVLNDPTLPDLPIVRVVSENLTQYMVEYVVWRVMDHHRRGGEYRAAQAVGEWKEFDQPVSSGVSVGFMGLGELGGSAARALAPLGFKLNGWSRRRAAVEGVTTFAGPEELQPFLSQTDILVVLLPLTAGTHGIIDYRVLSSLRRDNLIGGAVLINAGRGGLQKEADILRALEDGSLKEASLDVFEVEPLPAASPLWTHPRVFITPHAAAPSDPREVVRPMLAQMDAYDRGEPLQHLVDRAAGY
ncbi:MAG TPA: glyoxylate/hydroxypyruvate reductase A [Tianweitania sediminis]|jgi:glyoxylate/hydroxypyruvate reductase A|nr:glyoxylate/hydroxypyruvate reductase A [Tianweitania sediminis]